MFKYVGAALLIFSSHLVWSQADFKKGFIQLPDNQRIEGYLRQSAGVNPYFSCAFKESLEGEELFFGPDKIVSYGYDSGKVYTSKKIVLGSDSIHVFAERIVDGKAVLYGVLQRFFLQKDTLFLELTNPILEGRESNKYVGLLNYAFTDCPEVKKYLNGRRAKMPWTETLKLVTYLYNHCGEAIQEKPKSLLISLMPFVGLNYSTTTFSSSNDPSLKFYSFSKYYNQKPFFGGLDISILMSKISKRIALSLGAWYRTTEVDFAGLSGTEFNELHFSKSEVLIPLGVKWELVGAKKLKSYLNIRVAKNITISESSDRIQEINKGSDIYTYQSTFSEVKTSPDLVFGIGCSYGLGKMKLFTEANYVQQNSKVTFSDTANKELSKMIRGGLFSIGVKF